MISFAFAALEYRKSRQIRYRYRLEPFDHAWKEVGSKQRFVTYTNLDPGRYVFRVTSTNANGRWNPNARAIALIITPPWWATWWFRGLALGLIIGSAWGFYHWRVDKPPPAPAHPRSRDRRAETDRGSAACESQQIRDLAGRLITAQEDERARIAGELHDDINQQLVSLSLSLASSSATCRRSSRGAVGGGPASAASARGVRGDSPPVSRAAPWGAPTRSGSWQRSGSCDEFGRLHEIEVAFHAADGLEEIPAEIALCLYRVAQEALQNAARHAEARRVEVALTCVGDILELSIADDGRGFDVAEAQRRRGLGLISMDERVRLVAGRVRIESEPGAAPKCACRCHCEPSREPSGETEHEPTESVAG